MVGGKVVEVATVPKRGLLWVRVADRPYKKLEYCSVLVQQDAESEKIEIGDSLWWQCGMAYWTPQDRSRVDVRLKKIGGSGVTYESACGGEA